VSLAQAAVQACVVGQRVDAFARQQFGHLFHALAALAIHHPGFARVLTLD